MTERVDVVNIALSMLGANTITALDDDSDEARIATIHYDIARDATLEAHEWTFAIKRWQLAQASPAPDWGYLYRYPVPSDCLRVLEVGPNVGPMHEYSQDDYALESGYIFTDYPTCYVRGIRTMEDEGRYSNMFCHAFAAKLATLMAMPLTHSRTNMETMAGLYDTLITDAASRDNMQGRTRRKRHRRPERAR